MYKFDVSFRTLDYANEIVGISFSVNRATIDVLKPVEKNFYQADISLLFILAF